MVELTKVKHNPDILCCSVLAILFILPAIFFPIDVLAHTLRVFAWASGNTVSIESGLSGSRQLVKGKVVVENSKTNDIIIEGITNPDGVFSFSLPQTLLKKPVDLRIIASTEDGHRAEWLLKEDEYGLSQKDEQRFSNQSSFDNGQETLSTEELTNVLDKLLEKKLAPLRRQLAQANEEKIHFRDIIGGIGYIIGLAGLTAWFKRDKNN